MPVGVGPAVDWITADELNDGWITREDASLKRRLQGIRVPVAVEDREEDFSPSQDADRTDGPLVPASKSRLVPVYFRLPENEVRRRTFPYITIDFLGAVRDQEREHRGFTTLGTTGNAWAPGGVDLAAAGGGRVELPIPFRLDYQISQWSRYNRHDRIIMTSLLTNRLEPRFGALEMVGTADAPDDHSFRRMVLLSGPTPGDTRDAEGKRVFRKTYSVGIASELFQSDMAALAAVNRLDMAVIELDYQPQGHDSEPPASPTP